jgi:hypothetical protein
MRILIDRQPVEKLVILQLKNHYYVSKENTCSA